MSDVFKKKKNILIKTTYEIPLNLYMYTTRCRNMRVQKLVEAKVRKRVNRPPSLYFSESGGC